MLMLSIRCLLEAISPADTSPVVQVETSVTEATPDIQAQAVILATTTANLDTTMADEAAVGNCNNPLCAHTYAPCTRK